MKTKTKYFLCAALASFAVGACIAAGGVLSKTTVPAKAEEATLSGGVGSRYILGDTLSIEESTLTYKNEEYEATAYVTYPSGKRVKSNVVELDEVGVYSVSYRYMDNELYLKSEQEFSVSDKLFSVSSEQSTAVYTDFPSSYSEKAIVLSLANGDTFEYNRILDLSEVTASDAIIQLFHNPHTVGSADVTRIEFVLTDVYDSSNYVVVTAKVFAKNDTYMTVNAAHQPATGMTPCKEDTVSSIKKVFWRNQWYIVQSANYYGTWYGYSFHGEPSSGKGIGSECLSFSTDGTAFFGMNNKLLADLGDREQFTDIWTGFTTGEVYLSIRGAGYEKSTMNVVIPSILDHDLSSKGMSDEQAPSVTLDWEGEIPDAVVGKSYRVFDVSTLDDYSKDVRLTTRAYYHYYSTAKSIVELVDGAFTPKYAGLYTIEYTAKDAANNTTVFTVDVEAKDDIKPLSVSVEPSVTQGAVGESFLVATPTVDSYYAENTVQVQAVLEGGEAVYEMDEAMSFIPFYDGTYTIRYTVKNYVETAVEEYTVKIAPTDKQYVFDEAVLPDYFIKDARYELPTLSFYDFASGSPVQKKAIVTVTEDNDEVAKTVSGKYKVGAESNVKVVYSTEDGTSQKIYNVPVVDVGYGVRMGLQMDKYFVSDGLSAQKTSEYMDFTANRAGNIESQFINRLYAEKITVSFALLESLKGFDGLHFYLTDYYYPEIQIQFTYRWKGDALYFSVNGGKETVIDGSMDAINELEWEFDHDNKLVSQFNGVTDKIDKTLQGKAFEGFKGNYVYLSFTLENAEQGAGFRFFKINNQLFSNEQKDSTMPEIYAESIRGFKVAGSEVTIKASVATDVLSPSVSYSMIVEAPDGEIVSDIDGNVLDETCDTSVDHVVRLDKPGKYTVYYSVSDASDNFMDYQFIITVTDITPPTLSLGSADTDAKVGDTVQLAKATFDQADVTTLYVVVMCPDSSMRFVENGKLKVTMKGTYRVCYYATDAAGNVAIESYAIVVTY